MGFQTEIRAARAKHLNPDLCFKNPIKKRQKQSQVFSVSTCRHRRSEAQPTLPFGYSAIINAPESESGLRNTGV